MLFDPRRGRVGVVGGPVLEAIRLGEGLDAEAAARAHLSIQTRCGAGRRGGPRQAGAPAPAPLWRAPAPAEVAACAQAREASQRLVGQTCEASQRIAGQAPAEDE